MVFVPSNMFMYLFLMALWYVTSSIRSSYAVIQSNNPINPYEKVENQQNVRSVNFFKENFQNDKKKLNIRRKAQPTLCGVACRSDPDCQNSADSCVWCGKQFLPC